MVEYRAYVKGTNPNCFRPGEYAEIIGVKFVKPEKLQIRLCYMIKYADGTEDAVPVLDVPSNYAILTIIPIEELTF